MCSLVAAGALILVPVRDKCDKSLTAFSSAKFKPGFIGAFLFTLLLRAAGFVFQIWTFQIGDDVWMDYGKERCH